MNCSLALSSLLTSENLGLLVVPLSLVYVGVGHSGGCHGGAVASYRFPMAPPLGDTGDSSFKDYLGLSRFI